jgi:DNA mismatch repair protein MutS
MEQSVIKDYLSILKKYKDIYGQKTALLYQVGAFMEMYALQSPAGIFVENEELEKVANICNLALVDKKQVYNNMRVFMSGNREYFCEKYLNLLSDAGYTTIVYTQHKEAPGKFVRRLECVVSSGTHITYDTDSNTQHSNYILCIWIERVNLIGGGAAAAAAEFVIGISAANIFTGKTYIFEYSVPASGAQVVPSQFDELERQISTFAPSEIIFISDLERAQLQSIIKFSNIKCSLIHYIDFENEKARNCTKQKYINHVFSTYFGDNEIFFKCTELQTHILATQSFCFLLDFIYEHNPNLLKNINLPIIQNTSTRLILGNQTLRQLNIIDDGGRAGASTPAKFSSVVNFLNETQTPMGRRLFQQQLVAPVFDCEWLESQYNIIDYMLERIEFVDFFRSPGHLSNIRDLEKINRQIMIRKIYPSSIYQLHKTIRAAITLEENISSNTPELLSYSSLPSAAREFAEMLETRLFLEKCKTCSSSMTTFEENIFRRGAPVLHEVEEKYNAAKKELENIHAYLCGLATAPGEEDFVKIHETDKYGITLQITKRRGALLRAALGRPAAAAGSPPTDPAEIKFVAATGGGEEIISPHIREVTKNIIMYREKLNDLIVEEYKNFLENLENYYKTIDETAAHLAKIDVILTKAAVSYKNNYCRPRIAGAAAAADAPSYVHARGMRHVLIEHINQTETYVPNDVEIAGADGLLIYGVNTTGKTSYIRSVGISIIMAQSGMFVPCDEFTYKPYRSIFSRILGNDNLFHGLSTFAVEMSELRVILKMANPYTLVIGDEVCSGTENQSALSIFVAALIQLAARKCSFLFATHFHEILEYEEIRQMDQLKIKHMSVLYDRERDVLVYERKLRDGAGHRMYGIEICKSLHMPPDFIELAYSLRNKYFQETTGALSHKQSVYNCAKMRGMCEVCGERMSEETHHIYEQKHARENGYVVGGATFHKNHAGNLMAVCSACHDKIHGGGGAPAPEPGTKRKKKIVII